MLKQRLTQSLGLLAMTLIVAGCSGGDEGRTRGKVVVTPPAAPQTEQPAAEKPAEPAAEQPKPEMTQEAPAQSTAAAAATPAAPAAGENPAAAEPAGDKGTTFKGRVVVKGTPPPVNPIKPSGNDAYCINLGEIENTEVLVGEGGGIADVFVWVRKVPSGVDVPPPPTEPAVVDQKNCHFIPPALIVQVGQPMLVKSGDATLHNTHISGFALNFNQTVTPNDRDGVPVEVKRAEIVPILVKCDIHGWMSARLLATDNPWHALTDKDGNFEINNLPSGVELDFRLQHGKAGYVEKSLKLTLKENEVKEQTFELDASRLSD